MSHYVRGIPIREVKSNRHTTRAGVDVVVWYCWNPCKIREPRRDGYAAPPEVRCSTKCGSTFRRNEVTLAENALRMDGPEARMLAKQHLKCIDKLLVCALLV